MPKSCAKRGKYFAQPIHFCDKLICGNCDRQFNSKKIFKLHKRVTHNTDLELNITHICIHCEKMFESDKQLREHLRNSNH